MADDADRRRAALERGARAEAHVAALLEAEGWRVLARNWRGAGGELDVVVSRGGALRFVEVKLRDAEDPLGLDAIGPAKRARLSRAARAFLADHPAPVEEAAFLVVLLELEPGRPLQDARITWIDDAFDAG